MTTVTETIPDPMPYSNANDADQFDPESLGTIPNHHATADGETPTPAADGNESAPRRRMPWDRPEKSAPTRTGSSERLRDGSTADKVPALPKSFENDLADVYRTLGAMLSPFDPVCGGAIIESAPECAGKLVALARANADVRRVLLRLVGTSAVGAVIAAHTPILMAIFSHHMMPRMNKRMVSNGYGAPVAGDNEEFPAPKVVRFPMTNMDDEPFNAE